MHKKSITAIALFAISSSGCATVDTHSFEVPANEAFQTAEGIAYNLPVGEIDVEIVEFGGVVTVKLGGPNMVADPDAPLITQLPHGVISDNDVTIAVDQETGLLDNISASSTGRLDDIIKNLVTSFFFQGTETRTGRLIYRTSFRPGQEERVTRQINQELAQFYRRRCSATVANQRPFHDELNAAGYSIEDEQTSLRQVLLLCRNLAEAGISANPNNIVIRVQRLGDEDVASPNGNHVLLQQIENVCRNRICYRPMRTLRYALSVEGQTYVERTLYVPDRRRLAYVELRGGVFAEQQYKLDFTDGVLTQYQQNSNSEFVGLVSLPVTIARAIISAPLAALQDRNTVLTAENTLLQTLQTNIQNQTALANACRENREACPDTAYRILRVEIGEEAGADNPAQGEDFGDGGSPDDGGIIGGN